MIARLVKTIKVFFQPDAYQLSSGASEILERDLGHRKSVVLRSCVNAKGEPIPWFTYPAIEYIAQLDLRNCEMLEWGSGNSSHFFSARSKFITSIEDNRDWFEKVSSAKNGNHEIHLADNDNYYKLPLSFNKKFDIIIIDGNQRDKCAETALDLIKDDGLIIYDNSERDPGVCAMLRKKGLIQVDMHGFGPINNYTWTTTFFFTRLFNFEPLSLQPTIPLGGGY